MPKGREHQVLLILGEPPVVEKRSIRIGARRPGEVEVLHGLEAGDWVITHGMEKAREGAKVRIRGREGEGKSLTQMLRPAGN
mgnify:CR=1 FL=1